MSRHWTKLGDDEAPTEMLYGSAVVAWDESKAIITGGGNESFEGTDCVFMYNKETFETETLPSMLQARWHHAAVIVEANLFVIGGYGRPDGISLNSIEFLDLNNPREWKMFPASLEISRSDCSTVAVNEHEIYIMGGTSGINQLLDSVEILNTATKTISQGPSMLKKRDRFAAALVGDSIVVAGGWHFGQCSNACEQLSICVGASDEEARRWQPLHSNMNTDRVAHHGVSFGDCLVVVGGANRAAPSLKTTEVWNRSTGTWTQLSTQLPVQGRINGVVKLGQDLVCFVGTRNRSVQCLFSAKEQGYEYCY